MQIETFLCCLDGQFLFLFSLMILFVRFDFVIDYGLLISAYVLRIIHSAILLGRIKNTIQKMCRDSGE